MKMKLANHTRFVRKASVAAVMCACTTSALAWDYETENGWKLTLTNIVTAASSWRVEGRDRSLISNNNAYAAGLAASPAAATAAGYVGGSGTDSSGLNYDKGDRYSTVFKFISDLEIKKGDMGGLLRVKGWYDQALNDETVPYGHENTRYAGAIGSGQAARPLSDQGFDALNRFDGLYLLDAYVYTGFDVGNSPAQIRVGRQAVNWGESLFIQGVNQMSPLDVPSLRRAGTEIKEALLPVWSVTGNIGLDNGMSLDGFYQIKWEPTAIDSCGTFWAPTEIKIGTSQSSGCNMAVSVSGPNAVYMNNNTGLGPVFALAGVPTYPRVVDSPKPKNSGQWGMSFRFPIKALDTEFGIYAMNIHSRIPMLSSVNVPAVATAAPAGAPRTLATLNTATAFWSYPEDIKIYGLSAATTLGGVSWGAELSYQSDVPVQINGADLLQATFGYGGARAAGLPAAAIPGAITAGQVSIGPLGARAAAAGDGKVVRGFDLFNKTQFQINGIGVLPGMLGATNGLLVGELGAQWNDVPENNGTNVRYGRAFIFGSGASPLYSAAMQSCAGGGNLQPQGCLNDGFVTKFSWGYRLKASLDYPTFMDTGWTATPSIFWAHDVTGQSMDSQFNEGRKVLALGLKFNLQKTHNVEFIYTTYANTAKYDAFRDRDNVSVSYSYSF